MSQIESNIPRPNLMNQEWINHLRRIDNLHTRINELEARIEHLETIDILDLDDFI